MDTVIAIAIQTTGPDPYQDAIIDVGATRLEADGTQTTFGEPIRPTPPNDPDAPMLPVPESVTRLTGLDNAGLSSARAIDEVMTDLLSFIPKEARIIGSDAEMTQRFLQVSTHDAFLGPVLDIADLAALCLPDRSAHDQEGLLAALRLSPGPGAGACGMSETTAAIWSALYRQVETWPSGLLIEINHLLAGQPHHPLTQFLRDMRAPGRRKIEETPDDFIDLFSSSSRTHTPRRELPAEDTWKPLDTAAVAEALGQGGAFSQHLVNYEHREQQTRMAEAVAEAFNGSRHLMVEAGTGIGKSLAYLVPAVLWAVQNHTPVIISTNTKNLQSQLFQKDLPLIRAALGIDFKDAIIKGRRNYLCHRKLFYLLDHADQDLAADERQAMARVLSWSIATETGDMSEGDILESPVSRRLGSQLSSTAEECPGAACPHRARCFLYRARALSLGADVVVANHAVVFAEMGLEEKSVVLPEHAHIVFDEAHNIEDAATSWLSTELSQTRIRFVLHRLRRKGKGRRRHGLLLDIQRELETRESKLPADFVETTTRLCREAGQNVSASGPAISSFFQELGAAFLAGQTTAARLRPESKALPAWESVREALETMLTALSEIAHGIKALAALLRDADDLPLPHRSDFVQDLGAMQAALADFGTDAAFVMDAEAAEHVFWVERAAPQQGGARAWAAPVRIGERLAAELYGIRRSIIFSSATLSVRGSCKFLKKRLGLDLLPPERLTELDVGSPFDYARQCMVMVPSYLPEPTARDRDYAEELSGMLASVFRHTRGRGLVLFTSYAMLRRTSSLLQEALADTTITLLAQGESGSRETITERFKEDVHSVLLGTHSFWEGVDLVGETLSCLVVTRLPFAVFTDPLVEARCEQVETEGGSAFMEYSVPSAVIRFRQGFGRLIRHRNDRGIVIIADRRIISKRYGDWFRRSLPARTQAYPDRDEFLQHVEAFMEEL